MRALLALVPLLLVVGCTQEPAPSTVPTPTPSPGGTPPFATPSPTPESTTPRPDVEPSEPAPGPGEVHITKSRFADATITVTAGDTVTWTNLDPVTHTVTADDGSFDSGGIRPEYPYARSFETAGNVSYHCEIHPSMRGEVIVLGREVVVVTQPTTPATTPPGTATPTPPPSPDPASPTPLPATAQVDIQGFAFSPSTANVVVGTTVRWTNLDGAPHTATADNGEFGTGTLSNGASAEHRFPTAGTFTYFCAVHPSMRGTVIVS